MPFLNKTEEKRDICRRERDSFSNEVEITRNHLNKDTKKENFKKDLMNLIGRNYHINMTSDHSVSSNNSFKSFLKAKNFNIVLTLLQFCKTQ